MGLGGVKLLSSQQSLDFNMLLETCALTSSTQEKIAGCILDDTYKRGPLPNAEPLEDFCTLVHIKGG